MRGRASMERSTRSRGRAGRSGSSGPPPHDQDGHPLAPADAWGHDHLWWLDRMLRTNRPLTERMTLVWHDWFATSNEGVGSQRLMIHQNEMLRKNALGSFRDLVVRVTRDPAMLLWLSGAQNREDSPNENYARELMELFTLGADRGYTEDDVREHARALTGFRNDWDDGVGPNNFRFDTEYHDGGVKRIFGKKGRFEWRDSCEMCLAHPSHPSFFVEKLWSYFIPVPPGRKTRRALQSLYVRGRYEVRPVVEAILRHPSFYEGPRMVKPPVVYLAGLLRGSGRWLDTESWTWLSDMMRQRLFVPPNVAGWEDDRWLDTGTWRARWLTASQVAARTRGGPGQALRRDGAARRPPSTRRSRSGAGRRCPRPPAGGCSRSRSVSTPQPTSRTSDAATSRPARTPSACWWPPPPTCRRADGAQLLRRLLSRTRGPEVAAPRRRRGLDRRQFLLRSAGPGADGLRRDPAADRGASGGRGRGCAARSRARVCLHGRRHRLALGARPRRRPQLPEAAPEARARRLRGHPVRRGRAPALASLGGRFRDAARRGQGHGHAGRRLRAPGPVALQLAPFLRGGRAAAAPDDGLDGPLPRPRRNDGQPAPGPDPERRPRSRRWRPPACPCRRSRARATTTSGPPVCGEQ